MFINFIGFARRTTIYAAILALFGVSCVSRKPFWSYVVEADVSKNLAKRKKGTVDTPRPMSPHNVRIAYNDGSTVTEIWVPVLTSGQQIIIDHKSKLSPSSLSLVPLPPSDADKSVEEAYVRSGKPIKKKEKAVSIVRSHQKIRQLVKQGNYELALEYATQILKRYPNHVKTLRTKGSLLLRMGETEAAYNAYVKAQEVEPSARVKTQIQKIERQRDKN